jgi:hypothetical protein
MRRVLSGGARLLPRAITVALSILLALPLDAGSLRAQTQDAPVPGAPQTTAFNAEQLDALLAPIALYPDALLTPMLMAATEPLDIVQAKRWLEQPGHGALKGDALTQALAAEGWDPSVKALVPFPEVLDMMNSQLDWTQQLGYAFATQQADVLDSVQRLRRQAQASGHLQSNEQMVVGATQTQAITIQPANPQVVYVPSYNPAVVYGAWPYPSYPPVVLPPPPGYALGAALATGLAFGAGVAITAGLWNLATPNWGWRGAGYGGVNVNVNRWNTVNVNRPPLQNNNWRPPPSGRPGGWSAGRPPPGPVGRPTRPNGLPANAIGRQSVPVNSNLVNRPARPPGNPPPLQRPGGGNTVPQRPGGGNAPQRPNVGGGVAQRPGGGGQTSPRPPAVNRPVQAPAQRPAGNGGGAFGGMNQGRQANQFANRGAQSRTVAPHRQGGGGQRAGGGGGQWAGAGGGHGGGRGGGHGGGHGGGRNR